jgi:hypothetical protein
MAKRAITLQAMFLISQSIRVYCVPTFVHIGTPCVLLEHFLIGGQLHVLLWPI